MISIVSYSDSRKEAFKKLNVEWLEKYFVLEPIDIRLLSHPQEEIISKGGEIFFAEYNGMTVGTVALIDAGNNMFELGKMAVTEAIQGLGIGTLLMEHCINFSKERGRKKLFLYSNTKLDAAIRLYRKYGFIEVPLESGRYKRSNIKMEKPL